MRKLLSTILLLLTLLPADACPLELAKRNLEDFVRKFNGEQATKNLPYYEAMDALIKKSKLPNVSMRDQLSTGELAYFQFLREKMLQSNGRELALSNYQRDVNAIVEMVKVADIVRIGSELSDQDPRRFYSDLLMFMRIVNSNNKTELVEYEPDSECWIETGIRHDGWLLSKKIIPTLTKETQSARGILDELANKYKLNFKEDNAEAKITNADDRQSAILAISTLRTGYKFWDYQRDLYNIIKLHQLSLDFFTELDSKLENMKDEDDFKKIVEWIGTQPSGIPQQDKIYRLVLDQIAQRMPSDKAIRDKGDTKTISPIIGKK